MATVRQLKELLDMLDDGIDDETLDSRIILATQPSWPFEHSVKDLQIMEVDPGEHRLVIVEGEQQAYLRSSIRDEIGW